MILIFKNNRPLRKIVEINTHNCFHYVIEHSEPINYQQKSFFYNGCNTVFKISNKNDLTCHSHLENAPEKISYTGKELSLEEQRNF